MSHLDICYLFRPISQKRCNVCMRHIYKVLYDLSIDLVTFDLGLHVKVKSGSHTFQGVVSHKWCII